MMIARQQGGIKIANEEEENQRLYKKNGMQLSRQQNS